MTTDSIVEAIDQEQERLRTIRAILLPLLEFGSVSAAPSIVRIRRTRKPNRAISPGVSLEPLPASPKQIEVAPVLSSEADDSGAAMPVVTLLPSRQPPVRRVRKPHFATSLGALSGIVPSAPVVVRPTVLESIKPPPPLLPEVEPHSFAAMVRAAEQQMRPAS